MVPKIEVPIKKTSLIKSSLIAPCGMNCALCLGYLRNKNKCGGCRGDDSAKPQYCITCKMVTCLKKGRMKGKYCFSCETYPCDRMKRLDKRYRKRYGMSMLENLAFIKEKGIRKFIVSEKKRWICEQCDGIICVHRDNCLFCGRERNKTQSK